MSNIELSYLHLINNILQLGDRRKCRNGSVISMFCSVLEHDLDKGFPLLTTKRMYWKGIVEELAWFLRGSTNVQELRDKKVHIWDGNTSDRGFDAGPVYGFQWRHFDAEYTDCKADYTGTGVDQIQQVIDLIKNNPTSRRIILNGWNPRQQPDMCLPPCHILYQFYVTDKKLFCQMYQRSSDVFLGLPFNIASTALLTHLIAHETGLKVGKLRILIGDAHIYEEHVGVAVIQSSRVPYPLPKLEPITREKDGLWGVKLSDFKLAYYQHHGPLKAEMKS